MTSCHHYFNNDDIKNSKARALKHGLCISVNFLPFNLTVLTRGNRNVKFLYIVGISKQTEFRKKELTGRDKIRGFYEKNPSLSPFQITIIRVYRESHSARWTYVRSLGWMVRLWCLWRTRHNDQNTGMCSDELSTTRRIPWWDALLCKTLQLWMCRWGLE